MQIYRFSLIRIFPYTSLDSVHKRENLASRKPLYLYILCSVQLSLLVNVGTTFFSVVLAKFCAWSTKLATLCRTEIFKNSYLPCKINKWKKLDPEIRRIDSYPSFIKPTENFENFQTFSIQDPLGIKLLSRLRIDFSHLNKHKFRHNFADTLKP